MQYYPIRPEFTIANMLFFIEYFVQFNAGHLNYCFWKSGGLINSVDLYLSSSFNLLNLIL